MNYQIDVSADTAMVLTRMQHPGINLEPPRTDTDLETDTDLNPDLNPDLKQKRKGKK